MSEKTRFWAQCRANGKVIGLINLIAAVLSVAKALRAFGHKGVLYRCQMRLGERSVSEPQRWTHHPGTTEVGSEVPSLSAPLGHLPFLQNLHFPV